MTRFLIAAAGVAGIWLAVSGAALAAEPGRPLLDKATAAATSAEGPDEWQKVVDLCREAQAAGLSDEDKKLCDKMTADALVHRAEFHFDAAREAAAQRNQDALDRVRVTALTDLEEAVALDPKLWRGHWFIAQLHIFPDGDPERARDAVNDALKASADDNKLQSRTYSLRAQFQEKLEDKLADYNKAIELDPKNAEPHRGRAVVHVLQQDLDAAAKDLQAAVEADPRDLRTQEAYAQALSELGRSDDAIAVLGEAMKLAPNVPSLYLARSQVYARVMKFKEALADVNKILELRPNNPLALLTKAELERRNENLDGALADVKKVIAIDPESPDAAAAAVMQTEILIELKKPDSAIESLRSFVAEHASKNALLWRQLGMISLSEKKYEIGVESFNRAIELEPQDPLSLRTRGDCYISLGKHRDALKDYEAVLKFAPNDSGTLNNLAWLLCTSPQDSIRDGKRALTIAKAACEASNYEQPHVLSTLAAAYAETGDFEKALEWINKALAKVGDDPVRSSLESEKAHYVEKKPFREESPSPGVQPQDDKTDEKKPEADKPADAAKSAE